MSDKLGDMLLHAKIISKDQLDSALEYQKAIGGKLGVILVKLNFVKEERLVEFLSQQQKLKVVHINDHNIDPVLMKLVPRDFAEKHELMPIARDGGTLTVVTADPTDYPAIDELAFMTGMSIQAVLATRTEIVKAVQHYYYGKVKGQAKAAPAASRTPAPASPATTPATPAVPAAPGSAAAKRGRAAHVEAPAHDADVGPLPARPLDVSPEKLIRALSGLLLEKKMITLGELMERVARES